VVAATVVALLLSSCSSSSDGAADDAATPKGSDAPATTIDRPDGPRADLSEELSGGDGVFIGAAEPREPDPGYVEHEYVAAGSASSYTPVGELTGDGMWTFEPGSPADYRTRIIVRRPEQAADFSGTVVVEWLNVSGGVDADPDYTTLREELVRQGDVWVGVSAQAIGIEGGPVAVKVDVPGAEATGQGIKKLDPARYGSLQHPGDAYSYDIYTQVARALRDGAALDDLEPQHVVAVGESQSAFALVTYIDGVQPLTKAFDGFFVHSRGGPPLALTDPGKAADIAGSISGTPTTFRTDTTVPIFDLQTEGDVIGVLNSVAARQPDTDGIRLWEVAGTAHADRHLAGPTAADAVDCGVPVNDGPLHVVAKAAFRHFTAWVDGGPPPPAQPRLELTDGATPAVQRDADGIALGGVRTPPVDVPTRVLSGEKGPSSEVICLLFGSTRPLSSTRLAELYPSRDEFQQRYDAGIDAAVAAGVVLEDDRAALEGYAHPELVAGS
jgi:hypothetical protein